MDKDLRKYDEKRDFESIKRIWLEIAWIDDNEKETDALRQFLSVGSTLTAVIEDEAESCVHTTPGLMRCRETDLKLCAVTAVTTSHIGRKRQYAQRLTALQLAASAEHGAEVAALGMFEQGFYDRLGFGTGSYEHRFDFDPMQLIIDKPYRTPRRLTGDDWLAMHQALAQRKRSHGGCVLEPPEIIAAETAWTDNGFGLGYATDGELTHFIWGEA